MKNSVILAFALACAATFAHTESGAAASADASVEARQLAHAVAGMKDNQGLPFAIVDKKKARVFIFGANGTLQGASPVLLGLAPGDESIPGIGERKLSDIRPDERTTPAGRFVSEPGVNLQGEDIVWVDYGAAISMHRVRANNKSERRLERLASANAEDHRISYGCINVPAAFYDAYVKPVFGNARGVIYILPEQQPAHAYFKFLLEGSE
jgi:hypothetical protein